MASDRKSSPPTERGKRASFDRRTGEVHGSGSGAGRDGNTDEDYDSDSTGGGAERPGESPTDEAKQHPRDRHDINSA